MGAAFPTLAGGQRGEKGIEIEGNKEQVLEKKGFYMRRKDR